MSKKRICFIAQFPPPVHGLSKAVETLYSSNLSEEFEFGKIDITSNKRFISNLLTISKTTADLFYFTISQTRGGNLRDLIILKLLRIQHKKCLIHLHGGYYRTLVDRELPIWQRKANYKAIQEVVGAIALGPSLKWIFEGMIPEERIYIVPNCVDDEYLMRDEDLREKIYRIDDGGVKHILYLSNFIRTKGYSDVLEIARLEKERVEAGGDRKFHFHFAGNFFEKSERDYFQDFIEGNQLYDFVTYHGIVGGDKKRELLRLCHVFVLLTRYPNEGQPISILEAMGNGMVIVTTDHAGIPDIVKDGMNGMVCSHNQMAESVYNYLLNSMETTTYRTIAINNFYECHKKYTEENYLREMKSAFNKALK